MPRRDGPRTRIDNLVVTGYQKRKTPSKHYVFIVDVSWDNDERYEVFRRYSQFFSLHEILRTAFPDSKGSSINLPNLPKRIILGRSHTSRVAEARLEAINLYCQSLVRLDASISQSRHVIGYFSPKIGDQKLAKLRLHRPASLHPMKKPAGNLFEEHCVIAAFEAEGPNQISAESGDQVLVLAKDKSGWWLIERKKKVGWIPSSYLKKSNFEEKDDVLGLVEDYVDKTKQKNDDNLSDSSSEGSSGLSMRSSSISSTMMGMMSGGGMELDLQEYMAIDAYEASGPSQLSFEVGEVIMILDKMEDGWWFGRKDEDEGWVPCGYLEPVKEESHEEDNIPVSAKDTEKYKSIGEYKADEDDEISFPEGVVVEVLQKSLIGWWLINYNDKQGLAPATFLQKINEEEEENEKQKTQEETQEVTMTFSQQQQVPRQKTVRRKATSKNLPKITALAAGILQHTAISEESELDVHGKGSKPDIQPRKTSDVSLNHQDAESNGYSPSMPRRPRQTQIRRATSNTATTSLTQPTTSRSRSPSPKPRKSRNELSTSENTDKATEASATEAASQLAQATLKYVLVTKDSTLISALKQVISESPELQQLLKQ